jgi:hypothetical protein
VTCEWFSVDVTIEGDVPTNLPLYIAPFGGGEGCTINGVQCYGGLQTKPDGGDRKDTRIRPLGEPGFLFSRWGERSLDALRMSSRGACQSSGHEGDFIGVRVREPWAAGTYTYIVRGMDRQVIDGKPHRWLGAFVYSHQNRPRDLHRRHPRAGRWVGAGQHADLIRGDLRGADHSGPRARADHHAGQPPGRRATAGDAEGHGLPPEGIPAARPGHCGRTTGRAGGGLAHPGLGRAALLFMEVADERGIRARTG